MQFILFSLRYLCKSAYPTFPSPVSSHYTSLLSFLHRFRRSYYEPHGIIARSSKTHLIYHMCITYFTFLSLLATHIPSLLHLIVPFISLPSLCWFKQRTSYIILSHYLCFSHVSSHPSSNCTPQTNFYIFFLVIGHLILRTSFCTFQQHTLYIVFNHYICLTRLFSPLSPDYIL